MYYKQKKGVDVNANRPSEKIWFNGSWVLALEYVYCYLNDSEYTYTRTFGSVLYTEYTLAHITQIVRVDMDNAGAGWMVFRRAHNQRQ